MSVSKKIGFKKSKKCIKTNTSLKYNQKNTIDDYNDDEIFNSPIQFSKYNPYDILKNDFTIKEHIDKKCIDSIKSNIIEKFKHDFFIYQHKYNIGTISPHMSIQSWLNVNNYIFQYLYPRHLIPLRQC